MNFGVEFNSCSKFHFVHYIETLKGSYMEWISVVRMKEDQRSTNSSQLKGAWNIPTISPVWIMINRLENVQTLKSNVKIVLPKSMYKCCCECTQFEIGHSHSSRAKLFGVQTQVTIIRPFDLKFLNLLRFFFLFTLSLFFVVLLLNRLMVRWFVREKKTHVQCITER